MMDIQSDNTNKLGIILAESGHFKTTFLFNYGYSILEKTKGPNDEIKEETPTYGIILCNQNKLEENSFYFGKYSEVFIGHLKQIKLKYVKSFEEVISFLVFFRKIKNPPKFLYIDEPTSYLMHEAIELRLSKMAFLYNMLRKVSTLIPEATGDYFKIWISESLKQKELEKTHKDKENMTLYQKYFDFVIAMKKLDNNEGVPTLVCKRVIYGREIEEKQKILEFFEYNDPFMKKVIEDINKGLSSS